MGGIDQSDVYYDPYDAEIDVDPYPVWRRMRDEVPLYYNEPYDFYALSRFEDVEPCLIDWETYSSGRGSILELIKAEFEIPRGAILFEDPPRHDVHRGVMSRVFTPRKMNAIEPKVREFCARTLDPLVGSGGFDFIADLGAQMPMRTIGLLLGIPEQDQEAIRDRLDEGLHLAEGEEGTFDADGFDGAEMFGEYIEWRAKHPSDDLMSEMLAAEFEDEFGGHPPLHPGGVGDLRQPLGGGRQRDDDPADRLDGPAPVRAPRTTARDPRGPFAARPGRRGDPAL